jgi:hypothetical protein
MDGSNNKQFALSRVIESLELELAAAINSANESRKCARDLQTEVANTYTIYTELSTKVVHVNDMRKTLEVKSYLD